MLYCLPSPIFSGGQPTTTVVVYTPFSCQLHLFSQHARAPVYKQNNPGTPPPFRHTLHPPVSSCHTAEMTTLPHSSGKRQSDSLLVSVVYYYCNIPRVISYMKYTHSIIYTPYIPGIQKNALHVEAWLPVLVVWFRAYDVTCLRRYTGGTALWYHIR